MIGKKLSISELRNGIINSTFKGFPINSHSKSIGDFVGTRPNLFSSDFQFPVAVLRKSALDTNLKRMARYCKEVGADIAPHVKTHMSPEIAQMQIDHGAWALTVANFFQASVFLEFGFKRIFIANEVVEPSSIREISRLNQTEGIEIFFYVDSLENFNLIQSTLGSSQNELIRLFIEIGAPGARAGIRDLDEVEPLIVAITQDARFDIAGVAGFEGVVPVRDRTEEGLKDVRAFCQRIVSAGRILQKVRSRPEIILSAGGSSYFDIVVEEFATFGKGSKTLIRSGGYVAHDHGIYERTYPFVDVPAPDRFAPAIEVWAQVLSRPEEKCAILNLGKRDVGNDLENPFPLKRVRRNSSDVDSYSGKIDRLNDQHGYLFFDSPNEVNIGDVIGMGISHPCTTFDKWRYLPIVDDDYQVVEVVHTFF
jgi:D-serine deaminase-like pyridoxal phosphate-dependent protein